MSNDLLIDIIKNHNPFAGKFVVTNHNIWHQGFPDVPSLNAHASDAVYEALEKVRSGERRVIGITMTAERGLGKSHVVSRIRHSLQDNGSALFICMNQCDDLNHIKSELLRTFANSLKQIGSKGVSQWQELATALVNEAYKKDYTPQQLINQFPGAFAKNPKVAEVLRDKVLSIKPDIENPDILTAIIWTLSPDPAYEVFAVRWLSGSNIPQSKADVMGLANINSKNQEVESFNTVRQILDLLSDYKPVVVCFDEMESAHINDAGLTGQQVTAILGKDLCDKIKKGVVLTSVYPDSWVHEIKRLPYAESVIDRIGQQVVDLKHLNSDDVVALVSKWLEEFYKEKGVTPPHSVYPFDEYKLRALGKERPIVRKVLQWCADNFNVTKPGATNPVEAIYQEQLTVLDTTIQDYIENNAVLAQALRLGFCAVKGEVVEKVKVEDIIDIQAKSPDKGYINLKIVGKENGKEVKIGIAVLQDSGGMIVQATLKRLIRYEDFDLTRGCLIRSKEINKGAARAQQYLSDLLSPALGGEWVLLKSEDIKPLLAAHLVMKAREDYELSEEQVIDYIRQKRIAVDNYLIREILSDPSGQVPTGLVDEDVIPEVQATQNPTGSDDVGVMVDNLLAKIGL
ncbi:hypothetical protein DSM106972_084970 [Dulcicalothrix desertica PCC 7102]|uniref:Orc1-like AAA ATPase domain-containing protein n=1 Tax=Dulcicalothrix desertica PCC 7102 TaxID=232991 RepID=A0A433UU63_9CYAN|nr:hypothetical protein [Dulcicalothrix desertica]RUS97394.1 hypothetical protein DSM106972_084970 [Dulcicalothrix desertica PCC 7102]TWH55571.1 hypothetical protein CAL7102_03719 [Dulcicalothrix desertica PCC 7102]